MNNMGSYNSKYGTLINLRLESGEIPICYDDTLSKRYIVYNSSLYDQSIPVILDEKYNCWIPVSEFCKRLNMTTQECKKEIRRCMRDIRMQPYRSYIHADCNYGYGANYHFQKMLCLSNKGIILWLLRLDHLGLNNAAYRKVVSVLNKYWKEKYNTELLNIDKYFYLQNGSTYHTEKMLQKAIIRQKYINNIKIIKEEVPYDFGRIDLLGIDESGNSVCIELKKDKEFLDTKEQLLRYKNSNKFSKVLYIAHSICEDMKSFLEQNHIEYLHYSIHNRKPIFY